MVIRYRDPKPTPRGLQTPRVGKKKPDCYSCSSAVGILPLALQYGYDVCEQFLAGLRDIDEHFRTAPFDKNLPVLLGLLANWNATFLSRQPHSKKLGSRGMLRNWCHAKYAGHNNHVGSALALLPNSRIECANNF